jgi:DNA mismatch repair protein MSH6
VFKPLSGNSRAAKRRRISVKEDSDDEFGFDAATQAALEDDDGKSHPSRFTVEASYDRVAVLSSMYPSSQQHNTRAPPADPSKQTEMDDFVAPDDDEEDATPRPVKKSSVSSSRKASVKPPSPPREDSEEIPTTSTAQQWKFDPNAPPSDEPRKPDAPKKKTATSQKKQKAHLTEPENRYPWLAHILDADRNPTDHPDYDPRTIFIPPLAWDKFSAFEKQYWEIKQKFWDTIVFFKKGKFYELYEKDATIGHQLFDLKLTDRVNMRMVGVPEASLDHWANQFVAKGYKIARVDQMETALGKDMRERGDAKSKKEEKVIRRELATVLTSGGWRDVAGRHGNILRSH